MGWKGAAMTEAFFGKRALVGREGRRERGGRSAERMRECSVCQALKPVQCFAKEDPEVCRCCNGELLYPEKARRKWAKRKGEEEGLGFRV